jgi:hypothetical protein
MVHICFFKTGCMIMQALATHLTTSRSHKITSWTTRIFSETSCVISRRYVPAFCQPSVVQEKQFFCTFNVVLFMRFFFLCDTFHDTYFAEVLQMVILFSWIHLCTYWDHLHSMTNKSGLACITWLRFRAAAKWQSYGLEPWHKPRLFYCAQGHDTYPYEYIV